MAVFREVELTVKGETVVFTPSNRLLRRIDSGLAPQTILGVLNGFDGQQAPVPALSYILAEFMRAGGSEMDEDEVYGELSKMVQGLADNKLNELMSVCWQAISSPVSKDELGNSSPPDSKPGGKKRKQKNSN